MPKRLLHLLLFALRSGLIPAFNVLVSMLVVRLYSETLWGNFVKEYLWVTLLASILTYGSKDYLLRIFSENPAQIAQNWQISLSARTLLLPFAALFLLLKYQDFALSCELFIWIVGLFLFQSYEAIILYEKDFAKIVAIEMLGLGLTLGSIFCWGKSIETADLRHIFIVTSMAKGLFLFFLYKEKLPIKWQIEGTKNFLTTCFPFLLIGISGLLHSRADTYTASHFLAEKDLGRYQILMNLVIYVQSISAWLLTPFIKNIYRLPQKSFQKLLFRFTFAGMGIALICLPLFWLIFHFCYLFDWKTSYYVGMFLLCLPIYGTLPLIFRMYKMGQERTVMYLNFGGTAILVVLCSLFMPYFGIAGGLWAAVTTQWGIWGIYLLFSRRFSQI